jgi:hypothetical protein
MKAKYTEQHPDVRSAQGRLAAAQAEAAGVESEVASAMAAKGQAPPPSADGAKDKMKTDLKRLESQIASRKQAKTDEKPDETETVNRVVALETQWSRLNRATSDARDRMGVIERNFYRAQVEASSELGGYSDQVVVLDPAFVPTKPEKPGKALIVVIAAGASLAIAFLVAIVRALLDDRIYEELDLARVAPVLTVVPRQGRRGWFSRKAA